MFSEFLKQAGWAGAEIVSLDADYSTRSFARVKKGERSAIILKANPEQKTHEFLLIDRMLREIGLSAPKIYAADAAQGFVLMEDFGKGTLGQKVDAGEGGEALYARATEVLAFLHERFSEKAEGVDVLPLFNAALFAEQAGLFLDYYLPFAQKREASSDERAAFFGTMCEALAFVDTLPRSLLLRDYMLDNLMEAQGRVGVASVGILDFQDGGLGPVAYDLASLAEGVRREGGIERLDFVLQRYGAFRPCVSARDLRRGALLLSAQRHTRILGIFAHYKKPEAVSRAKAYLEALLGQDELLPLRSLLRL